MDPPPDPRRLSKSSREAGFTSAQWVLMVGFSMVFLALLLNLVAVQYAHGVIRAALDEGVRRASPAPAGVADCQQGMAEVMDDLLSGPLGEEVTATCVVVGGEVVASADAIFPGWFPGIPDIAISSEVRGVKEVDG